MQDPLGRHRFRDYLVMASADVASFDLWFACHFLWRYNSVSASRVTRTDLRAFKGQTERLKTTSVRPLAAVRLPLLITSCQVALHDTIAMTSAINSGVLSTELKEDVMSALRQVCSLGEVPDRSNEPSDAELGRECSLGTPLSFLSRLC